MFQVPGLLGAASRDTEIYIGNGNLAEKNRVVWRKPRSARLITFIMAGGGAGGAGGTTGAAGGSRFGGAGGTSGGFQVATIPAILVPDRLYLFLGSGGPGGAAGNTGTAGGTTRVALVPSVSSTVDSLFDIIGGNPGANGTSSPSAPTLNTSPPIGHFLGNVVRTVINNAGGGGSQFGAAGTSVNFPNTIPLGGGSGGGGVGAANTDFAGGTVAASNGNNPIMKTARAGGAAGAGAGLDGFLNWTGSSIFFSLGGTGGGSSGASGVGGKGGKGAPGSGGGGGGGGVTGGAGGDGGPGFIIVVCN